MGADAGADGADGEECGGQSRPPDQTQERKRKTDEMSWGRGSHRRVSLRAVGETCKKCMPQNGETKKTEGTKQIRGK